MSLAVLMSNVSELQMRLSQSQVYTPFYISCFECFSAFVFNCWSSFYQSFALNTQDIV